MNVSVITLVKGRDAHLRNLMCGLQQQTLMPDEFIISYMQPQPVYSKPNLACPVRELFASSEALSLAKARNTAAKAAKGDILIFLDVDCIPSPDLVADYVRMVQAHNAVAMGEVYYLPQGVTQGTWNYEILQQQGLMHPERDRQLSQPSEPCKDYRCFWSLSFAMRKDLYEQHGGFDERFVGYGAEDTDFARTCDAKQIPLMWIRGAAAYHQHHAHHMPPVHHIKSILANNEVFKDKWGEYTMRHWLRAFRLMGLIEPNAQGGYDIIRKPDEHDFALTAQNEDDRYVSTQTILDMLEAQKDVA